MKVFSDSKVERIHEASLTILQKIGIAFQSTEILEILQKNGVRVHEGRAYFTPLQVEQYVTQAPGEFTIYARDERYNVLMNTEESNVTPGYGSSLITEESGGQREALFDDFLKFANLVHVIDVFKINGGILVQPSDIDAKISAAAMVYATMKRSSKCLFSVCGIKKDAEDIMALASILFGGADVIRKKPCALTLISTMSPLMVAQDSLDTLHICAKNNQPVVIAPGPMAGGTGPITLSGNVAMANAEILGTIALTQILNPGNPVIYGFAATISDMRTMGVSNGSPGFTLQAKYGAMLAKKYGLPCRSGGGVTDANGVTAQAGVESAMSLFEAFQEGANLIMHSAGSLESFAAMSYEKFVLDVETINRLKYYFDDFDVSDEFLAVDAIAEVVEGELFVTHEHTLEHCRTVPWFPEVSQHGRLKSGLDPNQALYASMQKRIALLLDQYQKPAMDKHVESQLDEYMRGLGMQEELIRKV